jgi:hypothetical protein
MAVLEELEETAKLAVLTKDQPISALSSSAILALKKQFKARW